MPQSGYEHRYEVVGIHAQCALAVAAEWYVQIVAEPRRERYVPASPEVGEAKRMVGEAEVVGQLEAEYGCCTDTHVAIAREVEVYLYWVA